MPTTKLKNLIYRTLLPYSGTDCGPNPISSVTGHDIACKDSFQSLIRRHHVLGSCTLLESYNVSSIICTSSAVPFHAARYDTFFRVASITKTATAVLSLRLADQAIVSLDESIHRYLSPFVADDMLKGITIRHLLSHTSGLVDPPGLESSLESGVPFTELIQEARRFPPGYSFHYSNLGFGLIGSILEAVMKKPVGDLYSEYLFSPLKMNATLEGCLLPQDRIMPVSRVLPFRGGNGLILTSLGSVPINRPDPLLHYGYSAGSMYTDISSLQTLFHVIIRNEDSFLSDNAVKSMKQKHAAYGKLSPSLSYGLGLLRISDPSISGSDILGHQGFAYGCVDGAFYEENTGRLLISLNGGCSEARCGRLGLSNRDFLRWAFQEELPLW